METIFDEPRDKFQINKQTNFIDRLEKQHVK